MDARPFRALRPPDDLARLIASYPYDVVSSAEARKLARDDPHSFLHVVKPEIDLDPGIDPYDPAVYARGRANLDAMRERGWLVRDERPGYYVYRLTMQGRSQTGVLVASALDDYRQGRIRRHEHTRPHKEDDRVRLNTALEVCPGPVFLTYRGTAQLDELVGVVSLGSPRVAFQAPDGVRHELWVVDDPTLCTEIRVAFAAVPHGYVADGHHRAAAAARVGSELLQRIDDPTGNEPAGFFLAAWFPSEQLHILDYNRVVADLNGLEPAGLLDRVRRAGFDVQSGHAARTAPRRATFGLFVGGEWYLLTAPPDSILSDDPVRALDVAILADRILQPILGIGDPRTDPRIDFVGGIRGMDELEARVREGEAAAAFSMFPTSVEDVMAVADAGEVMPPKSTWFEPKLRSGLVVQPLTGREL